MIWQTYQKKQLAAIVSLETPGLNKRTSVVPMSRDYARDESRCLTSLQFIPAEIGSRIVDFTAQLQAADSSHYYYPLESLHMTVQNIRVLSNPPTFQQEDIARAKNVFAQVLGGRAQDEVRAERLLLLPTSLCVSLFFGEHLANMIKDLRHALDAAGLKDDKLYISDDVILGNITICRFQAPPNHAFIELVRQNKEIAFGEFPINKVSLVTTGAICHPASTITHGEYVLR
jgi:2'-5' RNA ligase